MKLSSPILALAAALLLLPAVLKAETIQVAPPKMVTQSPDLRPRNIEIVIEDHRFTPAQITLMPQEKVILHIVNKDDSAEEFESRYLKREKIVPGNGAIDVAIGPLKPGVYDFKGDFHSDTAKGNITVPQLGWNYNNQQ